MHRSSQSSSPKRGKVYIYGKHALMEALQNTPKVIQKVFLAPDLHDTELSNLLRSLSIPISPLGTARGKELVGRDTVHQGIVAIMNPASLLIPFEDFLKTLPNKKNPAVVVLGELHDPHNVGAIIRSAAAFGLAGVLIPEHNQAGVTGVVVKTSAGMAFRIPLVSIGNVNHTLEVLKKQGFWVYSLAMNGTAPLGGEAFDTPSVFVIGNEGSGVRAKTMEASDVHLSIPMHPRTESLNAAVSAAVVFYEWSKKHPEALL